MERGSNGRLSVTRVSLRPAIDFAGERPPEAVIEDLHRAAYEECFIANSVRTDITVHPSA